MAVTKKRINIAHIVVSLDTGGLENGIINLINNRRNEKIHYYVFCVKQYGQLSGRLELSHTELVLMEQKPKSDFKRAIEFSHLFRKFNIDVVHSHGWGQGSFPSVLGARISGTPVVINGEHGTFFLHSKAVIYAQKLINKLCCQTTAVSQSLKQSIVEYFNADPEKISVIPNGVDVSRFQVHVDKTALRKKLGLSLNRCMVGTVGRMVEVKNHQMIIKTAMRFKEKGLNVQFVIVGDGPLFKCISDSVRASGLENDVILPGRRDDVNEIMQIFDIFVLPSHSEGMSNTILEAMAAAKPVVATRVGGNGELVEHGNTGYLVEKNCLDDFSEKIEYLVMNEDIRKKLGNSSLSLIMKKFSMNSMVSGYEQLYRDKLKKKGIEV